MTTALPTFPLDQIPFSRRGAWINLSPVVGLHRTADDVHLVSHVNGMHPVLRIRPADSEAVAARATPAELRWERDGDVLARAVFASTSTVRVRGASPFTFIDPTEELTPFTGSYLFLDPRDGAAVFTSYESGRRYRITVIRGDARIDGAEALGTGRRALTVSSEGDDWEVAIEEHETSRMAYRSGETFEEIVTRVEQEFGGYLDAIAGWRNTETPAAALAAYVLWSATVEPAGYVSRESVLMSKHWMDKLWSWDHCFNALALAPGMPQESLDQFLAPFDHQDPSGALPDSITHSEVLYNFVKPPIHGWALRRLRDVVADGISADNLAEAYDRLAAWTRFWLEHRTVPGRDLPHYQHGNDSGWDNATMFDADRVVEGPDLAAFLLVQLDMLAEIADELGRDDGDGWRAHRARIRAALLSQLHDDEGFFAIGPLSGVRSTRTSLLPLLPVVAADDLPPEVSELLVQQIRGYLTEWGLATEHPDSSRYEADGYWRGPIWAPSTMLVEDGLRRAGHGDLADEVSARFRRLCERSGFAENFDAHTGEGLRDRAYTWSASVYLVLAREHAARCA